MSRRVASMKKELMAEMQENFEIQCEEEREKTRILTVRKVLCLMPFP